MASRRLFVLPMALVGALLGGLLVSGAATAGQTGERASTSVSAAGSTAASDERRFWVKDTHRYISPWYRGGHRRMINFGCTRAPYYSPDPRCVRQRGFHHGVDIAMRCGTPLYAGVAGRVVRPRSAGALGAAYGANAFRLRNAKRGRDIVIGHARRVFVEAGDRVAAGQRIALASDAGAPDGCHLHLEVRPAGGGYSSAVDPERLLQARRKR